MTDVTHYQAADIERRHEQHTCQNHRKPGVCVGCHQEWPCDARKLLDAMQAAKYAGTLTREARHVDTEWTAFVGNWDTDGHGDAEKMGRAIGRLRAVLDTIDGKISDPLDAGRSRS